MIVPGGGFLVNGSSSSGSGDPYWANVVLLLRMNGTPGSSVFVDEKSHTITPNKSPLIAATPVKFGQTGNFYDATDVHISVTDEVHLISPDHTDFNIGTQDFTLETWIYLLSGTNGCWGFGHLACLLSKCSDVSPFEGYWFGLGGDETNYTTIAMALGRSESGDSGVVSGSYAFSFNTWYHVAFVRSSLFGRIFINGVQIASAAQTFNVPDNAEVLRIGASSGSCSYGCNAYLDELRFTIGIARYTSNFTPQTSEFPNY